MLVDCGHGVAAQLRRVQAPRNLAGIVLSHMHPDHFFDLVPLKYVVDFVEGRANRIPLWLPPGGREVLDRLKAALRLPEDFWDASYRCQEYDPHTDLNIEELLIRFAPTRHFITGYAMRIAAQGDRSHSLLYSSDTGPTEAVAVLGDGASVGLVEATIRESDPGGEGHLSGRAAGALAASAGVSRLLLTHYAVENAEEVLEEARETFRGSVELTEQGRTYAI